MLPIICFVGFLGIAGFVMSNWECHLIYISISIHKIWVGSRPNLKNSRAKSMNKIKIRPKVIPERDWPSHNSFLLNTRALRFVFVSKSLVRFNVRVGWDVRSDRTRLLYTSEKHLGTRIIVIYIPHTLLVSLNKNNICVYFVARIYIIRVSVIKGIL